jgi:hypothetical protein
MPENDTSTLWAHAVRSVTEKDLERLHNERGYGLDFCRWLHASNRIGIFNGNWAFPKHKAG